MRYTKSFVLVVLVAVCGGVVWGQQGASVDLYKRDPNQPLNAEVKVVEDTADWTVYHVLFDSTNGQRVPALLGIPKTHAAPHALIMLQHGLGGSKEADYVAQPALAFAKAGYATIRLDACSHGERCTQAEQGNALARIGSLIQGNGWAQSIVDMRRGLDYCATRNDIDMQRIGYMGVSMGAIMGGVLCGVDDRIDAAALILGGSFKGMFPIALDRIDPAQYIASFAPRPLLMLNGKQDPIVPPAAAQRLYDAAKDPKRIVWYDTGHIVPIEEAVREVTTFFGEHVPVGQ